MVHIITKMSHTQRNATLLIGTGVLLIGLTIGNYFFDFTDTLVASRQYAEIQSAQTLIPEDTLVADSIPTGSINQGVPESTFSVGTSTPAPTPTPPPVQNEISAFIPDRIVIPAVHLDAPVISSDQKSVQVKNQWFDQWQVPDEFAAGWLNDSAPLGIPGNTVLSGHHNAYGKVFAHLVELQPGDLILVYSGRTEFVYEVKERTIVQEKDVSLAIRQENAKWISATPDERLTLVTCWPKRNNTHRLIIVATPVKEPAQERSLSIAP